MTVPYAASQTDSTGLSGSLTVTPPPGTNNLSTIITVYNSDGQNSTFLQPTSQTPFTYTYPQGSAPTAAISLSQLPQGASAMVTVNTSTMQFADGMTTLGFGTSDVAVRHLWVLNANQAIANITVSPTAVQRETVASVISGFQVYEQALGFAVLKANPDATVIALPVTNAFYPVLNSLYPGAIASLYGTNLQAAADSPAITVAGVSVQILYTSPSQINFVIPATVPTGPAVLTFQGAPPVVVQIDPPPPVIVSVTSAAGVAIDASQTSAPGDTITLVVSGIDPTTAHARIGLAENGISIPFFSIQQAQDGSGNLIIQFALAASVAGQQIPVTVSLDGDLSSPFYINVAN